MRNRGLASLKERIAWPRRAAGTALAPAAAGRAEVSPAQPLSAAAMQYAPQSLSPATRRAYASHVRAWEAWCQTRGARPCPASPALVANHLAELAGQRAPATLTGRLAAIVPAHALLRLPFDARDPVLRRTLRCAIWQYVKLAL